MSPSQNTRARLSFTGKENPGICRLLVEVTELLWFNGTKMSNVDGAAAFLESENTQVTV